MARREIFSAQLKVLLQGTQHMNLNDKLGVSICRAQPFPEAQQYPLMATLVSPRHSANLASYCTCLPDLLEDGEFCPVVGLDVPSFAMNSLRSACKYHWV